MRSFSDGELEAVCFDYFRDLGDEFTLGMLKSRKVQLLIQYCERRGLTPNLLVALQRERPHTYAQQLAQHASFNLNLDVNIVNAVDVAGAVSVVSSEPLPKPILPVRNPRQIFLCHAHHDADAAQRLSQILMAEGWQVWVSPHSIQPGEKWVDAVQRGLDESRIFLLLLSPHSTQSRWVKTETNAAIALEHSGHLQFVVAEIEPCAQIPSLWNIYQRVCLPELAQTNSLRVEQANTYGDAVKHSAGLRAMLKVLRAGSTVVAPASAAPMKTAALPGHIALPMRAIQPSAPAKPVRLPRHESGLRLSERRRRAERWQLRAQSHAAAGNYPRAVAALQRALSYSPKPAAVHADLARIHEKFEKWPAALASWSQAISADAGPAMYRVKRARIYERNGQIDLAIADYTCAIQLRPDVVEYVFARALLYERIRDGHALADFNRAIHLDRDELSYYVTRAHYHHQHGSYDRAAADYTRALDLMKAKAMNLARSPNQTAQDRLQRVPLWFARANSHYCKGNYAKAITDYTRILEVDCKHGEAYYWRGMSFKFGGEAHWATRDFQDALRCGCVLAAAEMVDTLADASLEPTGHTGYGLLAQAAFNPRDTQSWPVVTLR